MASRAKNISNKTANRIKQLRIANGLTQQGIAKKLFKSDSTVRMWELGKSEPDIETLEKLSIIYGVSVDYLIGNSEIKKPAGESGLPEDEQSLLELYRHISQKSKDSLIQMLALIDKIPDDKQSELLDRLQFALQTHL